MSAVADGNFSGKRVAILGCGYVGGEVARQALARGMHVTALTRNAGKAAKLHAGGAEVMVADLAGETWHSEIAGGADYVLDAVSSGGGGLASYRRSYVEGMRSIVKWAQERGQVGTIVYTSSTSVYPQGGGARVDETAPTEVVGERGAVLLEAERLLRENAGARRRWFVLRLAGIYGPGRQYFLEQVRAGEVAGRGDHRLNLIHRDDVCAAVWAAFAAPAAVANEIFNLADDAAAPKAEIAAWIARKLGVPAPQFNGEPAAGRRVVALDRVIANRKIKTMLGWQPRYPSFREGYENMLAPGAE